MHTIHYAPLEMCDVYLGVVFHLFICHAAFIHRERCFQSNQTIKRICSLDPVDRWFVRLLHILWVFVVLFDIKKVFTSQHNSYLFLDGFRCNMGRLLHTMQPEWRNHRVCVCVAVRMP